MIQTGSRRKQCVIDANTDLLKHIPADYVGEVHVSVAHGRTDQQFLMYFNTEPPFSTRELNRLVVSLQDRLEQGIEPDWGAYQQRQRSLARNRLEKQYLDGFFEYSLGFCLEKKERWQESGTHLETAMQLLHQYATPLAQTARRVLAIRMNCFTPLKHCEQTSVFYPARTFFVTCDLTLPETLRDAPTPDDVGFHNGPYDALATSDERVYIDGFTELVLVAIKAFYARDFFTLAGTLETLERHPLATDTNNEDKLLLLKARGTRVRRDRRTARKIYERLLYHPIFGQEAQEFCNDR